MVSIIIAILSLLATIAAAFAAWFSYKVSRYSYLNSVSTMFFNIMCGYDNSSIGQIKHNLNISNFCEYLCSLLDKNQVKIKDVDYYLPILKSKTYIGFVKNEIKRNPELFFYYSSWIKKNNLW